MIGPCVLLVATLVLALAHATTTSTPTQTAVLSPGFTLTWAVRGAVVDFTATLEAEGTLGWIAVGVSSSGLMVDTPASNAVIFKPVENTIEQYEIADTNSAGIHATPTPKTVGNFSSSVLPGKLISLSWTRAFDNGNASQAQLQTTGVTHIIFASGSALAWGDNPNNMGSVDLALNGPNSVVLTTDVTLAWALEESYVALTLVARALAWIGVGVSDDGSMPGAVLVSNAVICFPQNASATGQYQIAGYTLANFSLTPTPKTTGNVTCSNNATHTTLSFTRAFDNGLPKQAQLNTTGPTNVIFAVGTDPTFADGPDFTRMGSAVVNFST